jgi:hypothetical protein
LEIVVSSDIYASKGFKERLDPLTKEQFKIGDHVELCDSCGAAWHRESWESVEKSCSCRSIKDSNAMAADRVQLGDRPTITPGNANEPQNYRIWLLVAAVLFCAISINALVYQTPSSTPPPKIVTNPITNPAKINVPTAPRQVNPTPKSQPSEVDQRLLVGKNLFASDIKTGARWSVCLSPNGVGEFTRKSGRVDQVTYTVSKDQICFNFKENIVCRAMIKQFGFLTWADPQSLKYSSTIFQINENCL